MNSDFDFKSWAFVEFGNGAKSRQDLKDLYKKQYPDHHWFELNLLAQAVDELYCERRICWNHDWSKLIRCDMPE